MKRIYTNFDLSVNQFANPQYAFVPHKARSQAEIDRRRHNPRGSVLAEQQYLGLVAAAKTLEPLSGDNLSEAAHFIGFAALGSAYHSSAQTTDVMRRVLRVPKRAAVEDDWRADHNTALKAVATSLTAATELASKLVAATHNRNPIRYRLAQQAGIAMGNFGLELVCLDLADMSQNLSPFDVQDVARRECLMAMQQCRILGEREVGAYPTIAQLSQQTSPYATYLSNTVSNDMYGSFQAALLEHGMPI